MRVLITGAAGFIGFHLAKKLKKENIFVVGVDNFNSYYDPLLKELRRDLLKKEKIFIYKIDINERKKLEDIISREKIDAVVHLAAQAGVRHSLKDPFSYVDSNLSGFLSILEAIKTKGIKFIFASSSSVYGKNKKVPFSVEDRTDLPTNLYGATKKANELIAYSYHHLFNIPIIGLRYFTVYGPYGRPDMAYYKFTKDIIDGKPIDVFNNGDMQRDFTYIDDIIDGTKKALEYKGNFEIFNLGNNKPVGLLKFIKIIEGITKKTAIVNMLPMQKGEVFKTYADIEKSRRLLDFKTRVDIEEGMERFISWFKKTF